MISQPAKEPIVYRQLFAESEKRVGLLNECASAFFYIIQDVLLGEVQVSLSKLTEPARSGRFDRLSLEQLQARLAAHGDQALAAQTRSVLDTLHSKCGPFRVWRNKRLAPRFDHCNEKQPRPTSGYFQTND